MDERNGNCVGVRCDSDERLRGCWYIGKQEIAREEETL
jgi:hypothetical protein